MLQEIRDGAKFALRRISHALNKPSEILDLVLAHRIAPEMSSFMSSDVAATLAMQTHRLNVHNFIGA